MMSFGFLFTPTQSWLWSRATFGCNFIPRRSCRTYNGIRTNYICMYVFIRLSLSTHFNTIYLLATTKSPKKRNRISLYDFVEFVRLLLLLLLCFCLLLHCCCCEQRTLSFYCSFWRVRSSRCCYCRRLAEFLQQLQQWMSNCKRELNETKNYAEIRLFNRRNAAAKKGSKTSTMAGKEEFKSNEWIK